MSMCASGAHAQNGRRRELAPLTLLGFHCRYEAKLNLGAGKHYVQLETSTGNPYLVGYVYVQA